MRSQSFQPKVVQGWLLSRYMYGFWGNEYRLFYICQNHSGKYYSRQDELHHARFERGRSQQGLDASATDGRLSGKQLLNKEYSPDSFCMIISEMYVC